VDEVDSILIDEARTPLIISGPAEESTDKYYRITRYPQAEARARITGDKKAEERAELEKTATTSSTRRTRPVTLTEMGMAHAEKLLAVKNLWDPPTWTSSTREQACAPTPSSTATWTTW